MKFLNDITFFSAHYSSLNLLLSEYMIIVLCNDVEEAISILALEATRSLTFLVMLYSRVKKSLAFSAFGDAY